VVGLDSAVFFHILVHPFGFICMYVETWIDYLGGVIKFNTSSFTLPGQLIHIEGDDSHEIKRLVRLDQQIRDGCERMSLRDDDSFKMVL
jgi:hypothetical protein